VVNLAASGENPMITLIASFLFLIFAGAGLLMLPRSAADENIGFVDALFTSTSATCVTGLIVVDTGSDFSFMGQLIILTLIQLGGLGIIVFGAVFSVLLGQALSLKESVAMQDLLSAESLGRLGNMIVFIFVFTLFFEAVGAVLMVDMWNNVPGWEGGLHELWFSSIFHSISAFCNAGFSLYSDSFIRYSGFWQIYGVVCPLIILGGLGFGVLYNLANLAGDRVKRLLKQLFNRHYRFSMEAPKRMRLQTKIVLSVSLILIVIGTLGIVGFEIAAGQDGNFLDGLFQSVTARTAGFNTVDIAELSAASRLFLIILMFIGGSPGSAAGGIKTVTLAVIILTMVAAFRKRSEVECFNRSIRIVVVGRAITVVLLFMLVLLAAIFTLSVTERGNDFAMSDIIFEAASALGTVGLSTGITSSLTAMGKLTIIAVMLIGRLGPLTLLAALTFNLKPVKYSYPEEPLIVG
jgi:trk system potassium uptake protein TrkH